MNETTTKQQVERLLRYRNGITPSQIASHISEPGNQASGPDAIEYVEKIHEDSSKTVEVAPPKCRDCGFEGFDNLLNIPSQCPECRSEWLQEPRYTISK